MNTFAKTPHIIQSQHQFPQLNVVPTLVGIPLFQPFDKPGFQRLEANELHLDLWVC
jgi:hypothetical protein